MIKKALVLMVKAYALLCTLLLTMLGIWGVVMVVVYQAPGGGSPQWICPQEGIF